MNDHLLSLLLGIIEGLTEFLPVSSTAHLRLAEALFGISLQDGFWKMFTIVIQLGAILSVIVYFRRQIVDFVHTFPRGSDGRHTLLTHPLSLTMIAFVVTAIPAWLLVKVIGKNLESLYVMGTSLLVGGIFMWVIDNFLRHATTTAVEDMTVGQSIWIGAMQILSAVFPGASRSMCTIAGGQMAGLSREAALEFSFFLSIPTMLVATGYELLRTLHPHAGEAATAVVQMDLHRWSVLGLGFVVSMVVALGVIAWFMHWVRRHGLAPFAMWRIVMGAVVLVWASRMTA